MEKKEKSAGYASGANPTLITAAVFGIVFGISGMGHGFFEILQGNEPTGGFFINAIGEANRMWLHGKEPAFTVIPNFLVTGIAAMLTGFAIIVWSVFGLRKKNGPFVFLLLFVLLTLTGGGIAQVLFFIPAWAFATRIGKPLTLWRKVLKDPVRKILARLWPIFLGLFVFLMLFALEIADFGFVPGITDPDLISNVMVTLVLSGFIFLPLAYISGFSYRLLHADDAAVRDVADRRKCG